jgi:hypothetical protein
MWIIKIVFGILLILIIAGTGLFGYIAWKAEAKKWGAGCFGAAVISIILFYWLIFMV